MSSDAFIALGFMAQIAVVWLAFALGKDAGRYG